MCTGHENRGMWRRENGGGHREKMGAPVENGVLEAKERGCFLERETEQEDGV